jgi:uncharacterized protein
MAFHGRQRELALLDEAYHRKGAQLFIMYGRRGVGKTVLLGHWLQTRKYRHLFWGADQRSGTVLLRVLSQKIAAFQRSERPIGPAFTFESWEMAFEELGHLAKDERLVVVLDEFTYLIATEPSVPSILQRLWDHSLKHTNLMLVITGSHAGMIEREVLSYRAPLYHRFTDSLHLQPLPYGALAAFFPRYTPEERVEIFACLGGVPSYLELVSTDLTWKENLPKLLTSKLIIDDAGALLRDQLSEPSKYMAIVDAVAAGFDQFTAVATMSGVATTQLGKYLGVLKQLGIVTRDVPATETRPAKSNIGRYRLTDPYLRFYYKFLANQRDNLERGITNSTLQTLTHRLPGFIGEHTFEELCREFLLLLGDVGKLPFVPRIVGSYWAYYNPKTMTAPPPQIDVVAINEDAHQAILGECKWTGSAMTATEVTYFLNQAAKMLPKLVGNEAWTITYAFFCKSGFAPDARAAVGNRPCMWVDLKQLDTNLRQLAKYQEKFSAPRAEQTY